MALNYPMRCLDFPHRSDLDHRSPFTPIEECPHLAVKSIGSIRRASIRHFIQELDQMLLLDIQKRHAAMVTNEIVTENPLSLLPAALVLFAMPLDIEFHGVSDANAAGLVFVLENLLGVFAAVEVGPHLPSSAPSLR
jgi:hypothetical protein